MLILTVIMAGAIAALCNIALIYRIKAISQALPLANSRVRRRRVQQ